MVGKYKVITLCGSTRFKDAFMEAQKRLTLEGNIVISVGLFGHSGDDEVWTEGTKEMLDDMHKRKIDMADEIFVINVGGYIGSSTRTEIEYAAATGKAVRYIWSHRGNAMAITKTDFMRGMQCRKMLWLDKHKPSLKIIPPEIQVRLDAGNDFGDLAMGMFGPYEEMTVYRPGTTIPDKKAMLARTAEHMEKGTPVICEAAFSNYNNYCAVDILRKRGPVYDMYEVKNASELHDQFVKDAGFQYYILKRCRVPVNRVYIVLHGPDEVNLFLPVDVTTEAKGLYNWINDNIWDLNRMQKEREEVQVEPGECCTRPYECWYYAYCHGAMLDGGES